MKKKILITLTTIFLAAGATAIGASCAELWEELGECQEDPGCRISDLEAIASDMLAGSCILF